jgi:hypothetical protein
MNEVALQRQIDELFKELKYAGENVATRLTDLRADMDRMKLDMAALMKYMKSNIEYFDQKYRDTWEETARKINPEFLEKGTEI